MTNATATLIRELVRQAKGALASVEKWVNSEQSHCEVGIKPPPPEIENYQVRPEIKQ